MDMQERPSGLVVPKPVGFIRPGRIAVGGAFGGRLIRDGVVIDEFETRNIVVNEGLDHILSVCFTGAPQVTSWYLAPYGNNYVPVSTDKAATIVGNAGEVTKYAGTTRAAFNATEANQQVTNAGGVATFTFNDTATIYGAFLASAGQQNSTQGVLFSAAQFSSPKNVVSGDQLLLTYTFAGQSA